MLREEGSKLQPLGRICHLFLHSFQAKNSFYDLSTIETKQNKNMPQKPMWPPNLAEMEILAFSSGWQGSTWIPGTFEKEGIDEQNINIPGFHFRSHANT